MEPVVSKRLSCIGLLLAFCAITAAVDVIDSEPDTGLEACTRQMPLKILHVMSYHSEWQWNIDQLNGFKDALDGIDIEYSIYEMDTRHRSSAEAISQSAHEARNLIDNWKPDLIYTNDDHAQKHVAQHYVNSPVPIVFSGVNADPADYKFTNSSNVTGVTEVEHAYQTITLLKHMVPELETIALIIDDGPTWPGVVKRVRNAVDDMPGINVTHVYKVKSFEDYKQIITEQSNGIDAFGILGVFTFVDKLGNKIAYEHVLEWTAEHSDKPDFSFWGDRVELGTLAAVRVSGYAQGFAAGRKARQILEHCVSPADIPIEPTKRGEPALSLSRAEALGMKIPSSLLLNTQVSTEFQWEK